VVFLNNTITVSISFRIILVTSIPLDIGSLCKITGIKYINTQLLLQFKIMDYKMNDCCSIEANTGVRYTGIELNSLEANKLHGSF